nr:MAG: putative RNA-dependent RNA polymerase [Narnaviridae sp.]
MRVRSASRPAPLLPARPPGSLAAARSPAPRLSKDKRPRRSLRRDPQSADFQVLLPELVWDPVQVTKLSAKGCWQKANDALVDSFSLMGYKFQSVLCSEPPSSSVPEIMSILKSWTAFWLPHFLHDDTPPQRFNPYSLISSSFRRFIRNRVTGSGKSRKFRIGALLLYSKRLFPSFTKEMVRDKVADFSKAVARVEPSVLPRKRRMFLEIQKTIDEFCPPGEEMVADYTKPFPPSVSACYENSRSEGGLQAYMREEVLHGFLQDPLVVKLLQQYQLTEYDLSPAGPLGDLWKRMLGYMIREAVADLGLPEQEWRNILVGATGLTEPLKVRIVTKAEWFLQLLTPIQKAWHSKMRQHPVFELIGGADVETALSDLKLKKGEKVVSGDYSAATDNIFLTYTKYAAEAMLERTRFKLPLGQDIPWYAESFLRKLAVHSLTHASLDLKGSDLVPIIRGQMMGHILSFPLLCLINRAASCMAVPRSTFMKVNGDDVTFPASRRTYKNWKASTRCVGLEFSLGKNYYSRDLALINSVYCVYDKKLGRWKALDVPNVGLLNMPIDRQIDPVSGRQVLPWEHLAQLFREFSAFASEKNHGLYLSMFRKHYPILRGFPGPIYGPVEYGAFGATVPKGHVFTKNQLMWMNAHRLGIFDYKEGTRNSYSKICSRFEYHILEINSLKSPNDGLHFGPVPLGGSIGPPGRLRGLLIDPYARDGGLGSKVMAMRRWFEDLSSNKHVRIFGARRWNQFKLSKAKSGGVPPLPPNYLHKVLENSVWSYRPAWYRQRDVVGARYEDDASYLHEIFQAPEEEIA